MKTLKIIGPAFAAGLGLVASLPTASNADVIFSQTSDHCDPACGTGGNFITATGDASSTTITVTFGAGFGGLGNSALNEQMVLAFGLSSNLSLNYQAGTFTNTTLGTFHTFGVDANEVYVFNTGGNPPLNTQGNPAYSGNPTTQTGVGGTLLASNPGKFSFANGYGISYNVSGFSDPLTALSFTITNLSLATFLADLQFSNVTGQTNNTGNCVSGSSGCFFLDVIGPTGNTGIIDFGNPSTVIPLPPAALLFGTALVGMGILGRRRRKDGLAA